MGGRRCGVSALKEAKKARSSETMEYQALRHLSVPAFRVISAF